MSRNCKCSLKYLQLTGATLKRRTSEGEDRQKPAVRAKGETRRNTTYLEEA